MRKTLLISTVVAGLAAPVIVPTVAFAQASTATGAIGGAAVGAVVGGPVGAVVGGVVGAGVGAAAEPPQEVRTYVMKERRPSVRLQQEVVVGEPLPSNVVLYDIPDNNQYGYTVVNDRRVIVDPRTRKVVYIVE
ncbi:MULTISPECIES: DUF1236 domain-containing protein [unclassified Xanthobacter]|uniref:DUF1236 domain-containing protein n=1 Tax=Xanthobacter TaxID=279 RepID=UPI00145FAEE5|nr:MULTISPECIES: DUF1236 domain-containing protein [unclassified Xanthobacter]MBN8918964.1 DUF1236 domain-containing protein [Hyphomicrobiales bacterium]NMN59430.1 hypothetical protein [Xanthobacter sp. SG618]UJX43884.1 DUF1236 domain-containing protein [Xanthobacter sp. YC-JY1]